MDQQNQNEQNQSAEKPPVEMKERVISERVVSEKVLGSSSGIARFGRKAKGTISGRLSGVGIGLLMIIISFFVVWQSEKFEKSAALVAQMPVLSVEQAADSSGLVKVQGAVTSEAIKSPREGKDVLYYRHTREELELVREIETETQVITRDGQDIEQTVEREVERPRWVSKLDEEKWADLTLGEKINIKPANAKKLLNLSETYYHEETDKYREKVEAVLANENLLVVGEINNNTISGGSPFIISNQSNESVIASLESSEKSTWWILKIATLLLFGLGLYMMLGPLLLILDIIPILGNIGKTGLLIVCLAIGLLFTVLSSVLIAYWYLILILLVCAAAYLIYQKKQQPVPKGSQGAKQK